MLTKEKKLVIASVLLLFLAALACEQPIFLTKDHDLSNGLTSWKYSVNGKLQQETKYLYNAEGDLTGIEFYVDDKMDYICSYLEYVTVNDSSDKELKYRICTKRISYSMGVKNWEEKISFVVLNNVPLLKKLESTGSGVNYTDEYEYDDLGRKLKAIRTWSDGTKYESEYTYSDDKNLGVLPETFYFEIPSVYYNRNKYISWCTLASQKIETLQPLYYKGY
ncbi:MAG: hypothetical protein V1720_05930 [bacterium]